MKTTSEVAELFTVITGDYQACLQSTISNITMVMLMKQSIFGDLFDLLIHETEVVNPLYKLLKSLLEPS